VADAPDLNAILARAQAMQEQILAAQAESAERIVEGRSGGGVVRIEVTGAGEFRSVTIAPEAVDPSEVGLLEDLVLAALHDASAKLGEARQGVMGSLDLGGLGGLLGQ
jgi:nucleoid-associated protein EbfC